MNQEVELQLAEQVDGVRRLTPRALNVSPGRKFLFYFGRWRKPNLSIGTRQVSKHERSRRTQLLAGDQPGSKRKKQTNRAVPHKRCFSRRFLSAPGSSMMPLLISCANSGIL
jgi:hypothetical protein